MRREELEDGCWYEVEFVLPGVKPYRIPYGTRSRGKNVPQPRVVLKKVARYLASAEGLEAEELVFMEPFMCWDRPMHEENKLAVVKFRKLRVKKPAQVIRKTSEPQWLVDIAKRGSRRQ